MLTGERFLTTLPHTVLTRNRTSGPTDLTSSLRATGLRRKPTWVITTQSPILRNGDLCSYGSKEHKDIIMRASDDAHTIGFIIEMDSPGGSSMAKYDYEMALNYARSKGKKIVGHIDGMACSAGYALMALCDEVYFTNPHDTVGCIGTMCAMLTNKDGDVNTVTQERYAEIYADGSPYKNKEYRDAAEGNYEGIKEELNRLCADFQQMVRERRPRVTADQLSGKTYDAGDVVGTMVDGQGDFKFCVNRVQQLAGVSQKPQGNPSGPSREDSKAAGIKEEKQPETQEQASVEQPASDKTESQTQKQATMAKSYPFIQSAAKVNSLVVEENGGFYMHESMADNIEEFVMKAKQTESTLAAKLTEVEQLNATIEKMKKDHAEALANLNDPGGAADIVDEIRGRAGIAPLTDEQRGSAELMREAVLHERRLELAGENRRHFDLVRWDKIGWVDLVTLYADPKASHTTDQGRKNFQRPRNYYFPLPQEEIDKSNGVLVQNSNY